MRKPTAVLVLPVAALIVAGCGSSSSTTSSTATTSASTAKSASSAPGPQVSAKSVSSLGSVLVKRRRQDALRLRA